MHKHVFVAGADSDHQEHVAGLIKDCEVEVEHPLQNAWLFRPQRPSVSQVPA